MASTFIQFRDDESLKVEATLICKKLGIDLQTYMRMCLAKLVLNNGIPFEMVLKEKKESKGMQALLKMNAISKEYNNSKKSLDEINEEIARAREE